MGERTCPHETIANIDNLCTPRTPAIIWLATPAGGITGPCNEPLTRL